MDGLRQFVAVRRFVFSFWARPRRLDNLALGVQMHDRATVAEEKNMKLRAGAKRRSGGHFKGCICFGADL